MANEPVTIGLYPGSFDPVTNGHLDVIQRASGLVGKLFVAVAADSQKSPLFGVRERLDMLRGCLEKFPNVRVDNFEGLLVDYARAKKARIIFKGLRAVSDFEVEFQMALMNRELEPGIETVFLMTEPRYAFLSSSLVKEVARLGGSITGMVPLPVEKKLKEKLKAPRNKR